MQRSKFGLVAMASTNYIRVHQCVYYYMPCIGTGGNGLGYSLLGPLWFLAYFVDILYRIDTS